MLADLERFLLLYLNSPQGMGTMKALAVTTSGLYNLSVGKIRSIRFPMPPMAEQDRIRPTVATLMQRCDALEQRLLEQQSAQRLLSLSPLVLDPIPPWL